LALAGRVPVKVNLEGGPVRIGDYLTSSSRPGVAMRTVRPGRVIGVAMGAFDGTSGPEGKGVVFGNAHWFGGRWGAVAPAGTPPTIPTGPFEHASMDYARLREEGLALLGRLAGAQWTDFNTHDPGITILEQLCYAITDLGYRTAYP